jgi:hypothetical protein
MIATIGGFVANQPKLVWQMSKIYSIFVIFDKVISRRRVKK